MANIIWSNRKEGSFAWINLEKGNKYLTLNYITLLQGKSDITIKYNIADKAELISTLNNIGGNIERITDNGDGPTPIKIITHNVIQ